MSPLDDLQQKLVPDTTETANKPDKKRWRLSRRGFLIGLGVTGVGLALGLRYGVPAGRLAIADSFDNAAPPGTVEGEPMTWFDVLPDNRIRLHTPKVEMGQGVHTALAQIAAEELAVRWEAIDVVHASTARGLADGLGTGGSATVSSLFVPLREAAATLREMVRAEAARQFGADVSAVTVDDGAFSANGRSLGYGEVVAARVGEWEVLEPTPALKPLSEFRFVGQSKQRVDFHDKLTGQAIYGYDARLPGMLYGAVARPSTVAGKLVSAAPGRALEQPGVVTVVAEDGFAAVVAESRAQAYAGLDAMELTWDEGRLWQQAELEEMVTVHGDRGVVVQRDGNPDAQLRDGEVIEATYRTPFAAHGQLEPQAALAEVDADSGNVKVWISTQFPDNTRDAVAEALGLSKDAVEVQPTYLGGGFGRKLSTNIAVEAARLARAAGRPVHVGWNRTEEFRNGYLRPPTHHRLRAKLDGDRIVAIEHRQASGEVAFPFSPRAFRVLLGADFGAWRGATVHYGVPNKQTVTELVKLPVATGWWRGLGLLANTFAIESFIDELAHTAGADPLDFRLRHLASDERGQRFREVLLAATAEAGWGETLPAGRALGLACSSDVKTVVAQVAEVSLENGTIHVHRVVTAMDPGLVINPDGATAQAQGAVVMGLSSTLLEDLQVQDGQIVPGNFDRYPLLRMSETPDLDVVLRNSGPEPFGVGEPPIGPVAAAVANAVFTLTGQRLRTLPLSLNARA
ncbi:MAG: molybdopterin cofactor-binding domain-containing protein [Trueperaceae bacterium]|nr:molybdopterin cofactor-binding domain-containing protein [Trueperaceae bacterium]